jgi:hypothetical protein
MTPKTPQCEVFWALLLNSKHSGVPEDSKFPTLEVLGFTPTLGQSGVATLMVRVFAPIPRVKGSNFISEVVVCGQQWYVDRIFSYVIFIIGVWVDYVGYLHRLGF